MKLEISLRYSFTPACFAIGPSIYCSGCLDALEGEDLLLVGVVASLAYFRFASSYKVCILHTVRMDYVDQLNGLSHQLSALSGTDQIQVAVNNHADSPHRSLYKNTRPAEDQARRWRNELFEVERNAKRRDKFNSNRDLNQVKNPWSEKSANKSGKSGRQGRKRSMIMLAEWFLFMPKDFETDYLFKLCPKGRHVCVVAWKGRTDVYARSGTRIESFLSRLPGGGLGQSSVMMHRYETVLDCIMVDNRNKVHQDSVSSEFPEGKLIFMVLDLISFKSTSYDDVTVNQFSLSPKLL